MSNKKQAKGLTVIAMLCLSLIAVACGDATSTPLSSSAAPTTTTAATTSATSMTPAADTTASATSVSSSPAATTADSGTPTSASPTPGMAAGSNPTPSATTPAGAATNKKGTGVTPAMLQTPDGTVKALLEAVQRNNPKETVVNQLLTQTLRTSLKGKKEADELAKLIGVSTGTNIDTITVNSPTVNGDNASVTATLKLKDGSSVTDKLDVVKTTITDKKGQSKSIWQIAAITHLS